MTNPYCEPLGLKVPDLASVKDHREANTFSLLLVALLERGGPMTLVEVAERFEAAGVQPAQSALRSLKRCRPARAPVYREDDAYGLDPYSDELDLWAFRLGLRPPKVKRPVIEAPEPQPLPGPEVALTLEELEEAFEGAWLGSWSDQRLALAVLDTQSGRMAPADVLEVLRRLLRRPTKMTTKRGEVWRSGAFLTADETLWEANPEHPALISARQAVRQRLQKIRRHERVDVVALEANRRAAKTRREAHVRELAQLRRVLVHTFPVKKPAAVVLIDIASREVWSALGPEGLEQAGERLETYDFIAGEGVRTVLRELGFEPAARRLADLAPPRKTRKINRRGQTLKITTALLVQGSCGLSKPFGVHGKLGEYLRGGQSTRLLRRLEADAKSLFALYQYGRTHGVFRLRWGFLDERQPVSWVYRDEPILYHLKETAEQIGEGLEIVVGRAPGWQDPWASSIRCRVVRGPARYVHPSGAEGYRPLILVDEDGFQVDEPEIQLARLTTPVM